MYNLRFSLGSVTHFMGETKIRNQTDIFFLEHSELNKREWSSKLVGRRIRVFQFSVGKEFFAFSVLSEILLGTRDRKDSSDF